MRHLPFLLVWISWISSAWAANPLPPPKFCRPGADSISAGQPDMATLPEITARSFEFTGATQDRSGKRRWAFSYSGETAPTPGKIVLLRRQDREYVAVRIRKAAPLEHKVFVRVLCRYDENFEHPAANDLLTAIEKTGEILASAPSPVAPEPEVLAPPEEELAPSADLDFPPPESLPD